MNFFKLILLLSVEFIESQTAQNNACPSIELYHSAEFSNRCYHNPDVLSDIQEITARQGFQTDGYTLTTSDGYILTLFRITSSEFEATNGPVFIQHGILASCIMWTAMSNRSIAYYFIERGYDVWLGNTRGSYFSNKHLNLSINDPSYWNFNLDTIAAFDIPTQLKFIFEKTGKKITYIGHSMGTTVVFMYTSSNPEAENYIKEVFALAPVVYINDISIIELVEPLGTAVINVLGTLQIKGLLYQEDAIHGVLYEICRNLIPEMCYQLLNLAGKTEQFLPDDLLLFYSYFPGGISIYMLKQYLQITKSKQFQKFDYGTNNLNIYGSLEPPLYNLSDVIVPVHLFYGENDIFYRKKNIKRLYNEIGSLDKSAYSVGASEGQPFNHLDFIFAKNVVHDLFVKMFDILNNEN